MLGFYVTGHPLDHYRDKMKELATHDSSNLEGLDKGTSKSPSAASSPASSASAIAKASPGRRCSSKISPAQWKRWSSPRNSSAWLRCSKRTRPCSIRGLALPEESAPPKVSRAGDRAARCSARAAAVADLDQSAARTQRRQRAGGSAAKLFQQKPGETQVRFRLELPRDFSVILDVPAKVRPDREFKEALEKICGPDAIEVLAS